MEDDMELSEFTITLLYLGIPGIVCYYIVRKLTGVSSDNAVHQVLAIFLFSFLSYGLVMSIDCLVFWLFGLPYSPEFMDVVLGKSGPIQFGQLLRIVDGGILVAFILSYGHRFNIVNFFGQTIRSTQRYGDEDVWHFFHNAPAKDKNDGWLFIRDHKCNLSYHCCVPTWSDTNCDREMVLSDVTVFTNDTVEYLYKCALIYLCRNKDDITIEVPVANPSNYPEYRLQDSHRQKGDETNATQTTN